MAQISSENRIAKVYLIENHNARFIIQLSIGENPLNRTDLRLQIGNVHNVNEKIRISRPFQSGLEGVHQSVGEISNEADGVRNHQLSVLWKTMRRVVTSSVAKSLFSVRTSLCVTALKRVLFQHWYSQRRPRWAHVERFAFGVGSLNFGLAQLP